MNKYWTNYLPAVLLVLLSALPAMAAAQNTQKGDLDLFYGSDEMVETASHVSKPISQVAENVSIVTAEDIAAMPGVHTITDVLNRVPGIFIESRGDFASSNAVEVQGSDYKHVVFLIDGVRWNKVADGITFTNSIPLLIVRRIEVIKGAASSAWGSALGGVINIITKEPGTTSRPTGTVSVSYGEHATHDDGVDARGRVGRLGYYLYAGDQQSNGLLDNRYFHNRPLYGKLRYALPGEATLAMSMGYTAPDYINLHASEIDYKSGTVDRNFFYTADLSVPLQSGWGLNVGLHSLKNDLTINGSSISSGALYSNTTYEQARFGGEARLTWHQGIHAAVLGGEFDRANETDQDQISGYRTATMYEEAWALYLNDTMSWQRFSLTPGLRYDYSSISDNMLDPSLGLTYQFTDALLLRASVARGFRKSSLNTKQGDPLIYGTVPSQNLQPERIWTYQAGFETRRQGLGSLKATLFWHQSDGVPTYDPAGNQYVNGEGMRRQGVEIEARSIEVHDLSLIGSYTYVYQRPDTGTRGREYNVKLTLNYDDHQGDNVQLFGNYIWWGAIESPDYFEGRYNTFIWDLSGRKRLPLLDGLDLEAFAVLHNLFSGSQYADTWQKNAPRWLEAGLRLYY